MTEPTLDVAEAMPVAGGTVEAEPLEAVEVANTGPDEEAANDEAGEEQDESPEGGNMNKPAARQTVKLPDEPYDFTQCIVTVTLGFLPGGSDAADRRVIAMIDSHDDAPTKVLPLRLAQLQPLPAWLEELFEAHRAALPAMEAVAKARKEAEAKREAERKARSTRTAGASRSPTGKGAKGKLAKLGEMQDVLFGGGEPLTVAAPAVTPPPPAPPPAPVQTPPAPAATPQPKTAPVPAIPAPQPAQPLTMGAAIPAPAKRLSKKQPALQDEAEAVQDVLFS